MSRKKRAVIAESKITQDLCKRMLGEPFTESGLNGNAIRVDVIGINDRGVIVLPKDVREKLDFDRGCECMVLTMAHEGIVPTIMLIPVCRLCIDNDGKGTSPEDCNGPD